MPPSTPTFYLVFPVPPPDDYEKNILELERLPVPRTGDIDDVLSDYNTLIRRGQFSSLADIYTLGRAILSYLNYVDQYLRTLRVVYIEKFHFRDPVKEAFESFVFAYRTSFIKYHDALTFSLKVLFLCKELAQGSKQSDEDDKPTEEIATNLSSLLKLQDEIKTLFKTPLDVPENDKAGDIDDDDLFGPLSPMPYRKPPQVREVFFTVNDAPHWVLKDTSVKVRIFTPETNTAFWANMKSTIPILRATLSSPGSSPEGAPSCPHLDHPSPYIRPPAPPDPYAHLSNYVTPPQSPKLPIHGQFEAALEAGDKFFTMFIQRLSEPPPPPSQPSQPPKQKKTDASTPTKVTKKYRKPTKLDGGKLGAKIAALAADDALLQKAPSAADQVMGGPPVSSPAAKGRDGHASHGMKKNKGVSSAASQSMKGKSTMKGDQRDQ